MNPDDLKKQVDNLSKDVKSLEDKLKKTMKDLETHTHSGVDGSSYIYNDSIRLKPNQQLGIGNFSLAEFSGPVSAGGEPTQRGFLLVGDDVNALDGIQNAQISFENQPSTDGTTNQTFLYAFRGPALFALDGIVTSGGTTLKTKTYSFTENQLAGAYINIRTSIDATTFESHLIASNTTDTITITGTTWGFSSNSAYFFIYVPVYLGAADYPWRRIYANEVRIGQGPSAGTGVVYIRTGTGSPEGVETAGVGSLFLRRDGGSGTTLYVKESGTGSTGWSTTA